MHKEKKSWRIITTALTISSSFYALPVLAQKHVLRPASSGTQARHAHWNSDGAPRPPSMWRGHGGTMWAIHYHSCRKRYGVRYDHRTDMVHQGRNKERCTL